MTANPTTSIAHALAAVTAAMRARKVNGGKHESPTLIAWADEIDNAVAALLARNAEQAEQINESKQQRDRVAKTIGADCDCVDDVFAKADALAAENKV
jgi:hypothetical protein